MGKELITLKMETYMSEIIKMVIEMEMELYRLKLCSEQIKLGVQFVGKYATTCEGIKVSIPPNQVLPHTHKIEK